MKSKSLRRWVLAAMAAAFIGLGLAYWILKAPNLSTSVEEDYFYIPNGTSFETLTDSLISTSINQQWTFDITSKLMRFHKSTVKPGRYRLRSSWSNVDLIRQLRSGRQEPLDIRLQGVRFATELAAQITEPLEIDSSEFYQALTNYIEEKGLSQELALTCFIPNTYEVYWNVTADDLLERMIQEKKKFWRKPERQESLKALGMTEQEVHTLASIVEKESNHLPERKTIAGVYLNRLRRGIALQADPTVVYANRIFDTGRVLFAHLEHESPYNTYRYPGLPPGPICLPSISSIEAVLEDERHDYLYFCADPQLNGKHVFAKTLAQHNRNARAYREAVFR